MYIFRVLLFIGIVNGHSYYKLGSDYKPLELPNNCLNTTLFENEYFSYKPFNCTFYQLSKLDINLSCLGPNVIRIIGEYNMIQLICSSKEPIEFTYNGIQPTEAIEVEYYKDVLPFSNGNNFTFGVAVRIRSVQALYSFYTSKFEARQYIMSKRRRPPRHDYPRSGNFIFHGIHPQTPEANFFIYLEDSGKPSFLRNLKTQVTTDTFYTDRIAYSRIHLPCIPSHSRYKVTVTAKSIFTNLTLDATPKLVFTKSVDTYQGLYADVPRDTLKNYLGTYTCFIYFDSQANNSVLDELFFEFKSIVSVDTNRPNPIENPITQLTLHRKLPGTISTAIKFIDNVVGDDVRLNVICQSFRLSQGMDKESYFAIIEAENSAMMDLKREFVFPLFVNRSYTAIHVMSDSASGLEFPETFNSRNGGATFCMSGSSFELEEFAVPFTGDIIHRRFYSNWMDIENEIYEYRRGQLILIKVVPADSQIYETMPQTFECKFSSAIMVKPAVWNIRWKNGTEVEEVIDYNWTGNLRDTSSLTIKSMHREIESVSCAASLYYDSTFRLESVQTKVIVGAIPKIVNETDELVLRLGAHNQVLTCTATGRPVPAISWKKDGNEIPAHLTANGSLFHQISKVEAKHAGNYVCRAVNILGEDVKIFKYSVEGDGLNFGAIIGIPVTILLVASLCLIYMKFIRKENVGLTKAEVAEFREGEKEPIGGRSFEFAHEFTHQVPYDTLYELDDSKFKIDTTEVLGAGAFGVVYKGIVDGRPVAVKTTKKNAEKGFLKALLSELKIMIYLGYHENIVQLIGASTKYLNKGIVYIFVPLCEFGNLQKYLRTNRLTYQDSKDTVYLNEGADSSKKCELTFKDLLNWSIQVADGMEYLSNKKVIHGDLAARNVLLTEMKVARITDFGLSRQLYGYASYVKKSQEPLPWRWMALEALKDLTFSSMSDAWSYGILLWEIFTFAEVPYPGMTWNLHFTDQLEHGLRMSCPKQAPEELYNNIMRPCWLNLPNKRPTFPIIRDNLSKFIQTYSSDPLNKHNELEIERQATSTSAIIEEEAGYTGF